MTVEPSRLPIGDLVREAERILAQREAHFQKAIDAGTITAEAAAHSIALSRQIADVLALFQRFETAFRATARDLIRTERTLRSHPAVEAVLDVWPDAAVSVREASISSDVSEEDHAA